MKRKLSSLAALALVLALGVAGCSNSTGPGSANVSTTASNSGVQSGAPSSTASATVTSSTGSTVAAEPFTVTYSDEDLDASWDTAAATTIVFNGTSVKVLGTGAVAQGGDVSINKGGVYVLSGTLNDGQIIVDSEDKETVRIVLNGVSLTCKDNAPLYVTSANKTIITLAEGTENSISDGSSYTLDDSSSDEPNAAIYCKSDLTINGTGFLTVAAHYNNGIVGKDDLKIVSGHLTVTAVNDAIKGRDCLGVKEGNLTLTAGGDGLQANNDEDPQRGYISLEEGTFTITAGHDAIQAETTLLITGGDYSLASGGGSNAGRQHTAETGGFGGRRSFGTTSTSQETTTTSEAETATTTVTSAVEDATASDSAKGLKAGVIVAVKGGTFSIDSADDAIHSNGEVEISGGTLTISSGDDAVHADSNLQITEGSLEITTCYEGLEGSQIGLSGGTLHIKASDDGVNTVPGDDDTTTTGGQQGPGAGFAQTGDNTLTISGGYLVLDADGDGLDVNGPIEMSGGTVIINGPTNNGNGALDYGNEFKITGGYLVAVGSSGMAMGVSDTSTQYSLMVNFDEMQEAGTLIHLESAEGEDILTFAPSKQYQSLVFSSPALKQGGSYTVYLGGASTGTATDGVYSNGTYSGGAQYTTLTLTSVFTSAGATAGGQGGGMRNMQGGAPNAQGEMPTGSPRKRPGE